MVIHKGRELNEHKDVCISLNIIVSHPSKIMFS